MQQYVYLIYDLHKIMMFIHIFKIRIDEGAWTLVNLRGISNVRISREHF